MNVYNEVARIMQLPDISHIYHRPAAMVSLHSNKAWCLHMNTIQSLRKRSLDEKWTPHQMIGELAQDSANVRSTLKHDYATNMIKGGNESHHLETCTHLVKFFAQKLKDAQHNDATLQENSASAATEESQQSSIMDKSLNWLRSMFSSYSPYCIRI